MRRHRGLRAVPTADQRGGVAATGPRDNGHSAIIAAAWIETLQSRAQRDAERHLRSA
jgi:hypothetical protein